MRGVKDFDVSRDRGVILRIQIPATRDMTSQNYSGTRSPKHNFVYRKEIHRNM